MLAPGSFDATLEKWTTAGVWKGMRPLDPLVTDPEAGPWPAHATHK